MSREHCSNANEQCPYFYEKGSCFADLHHTQWPRDEYTSTLESAFRNLPENKQQLCRMEHQEIHRGEPPVKPSQELMRHAVQQAQALGYVTLSATKRKKIGL